MQRDLEAGNKRPVSATCFNVAATKWLSSGGWDGGQTILQNGVCGPNWLAALQ